MQVFVENAVTELQRHRIARERHEFRAELEMEFVERR